MTIEARYGCISFDDEHVITRTELLRAIVVAVRANIITFADIEQAKELGVASGVEGPPINETGNYGT